jgi:lipid-A-disaccharide synthase
VTTKKPIIRVGIVAGELSGDRLGANIISGLKKTHHVELYGVGGPRIIDEGLVSIFDFSKLHVMGLLEPFLKIRELKNLQKKLISLFIEMEIDYFIGIDSPDFNIGIHKKLKQIQIGKNIQVVSPSVWGWREGRVKNIYRFIDLTMCLFHFEHEYYKERNIPSIHLGHPFSKLFPKDKDFVFKKYSLDHRKDYISILPGSRISEIKKPFTYIHRVYQNTLP